MFERRAAAIARSRLSDDVEQFSEHRAASAFNFFRNVAAHAHAAAELFGGLPVLDEHGLQPFLRLGQALLEIFNNGWFALAGFFSGTLSRFAARPPATVDNLDICMLGNWPRVHL